jgi:hypothetical protein
MEGSFKTMPCSGVKMTVLTVPKVNRQIIGEEAAEDIHNDCTP